MLHGKCKCDADISFQKSLELSKLLSAAAAATTATTTARKKDSKNDDIDDRIILKLIEDGDHRLSRPQDIKLILDTLHLIIQA